MRPLLTSKYWLSLFILGSLTLGGLYIAQAAVLWQIFALVILTMIGAFILWKNRDYFIRCASSSSIAVNLLVVFFLVLSVQFIAKVYAMSFTLSSTTSETKVSKKVFFADVDSDGDIDALVFNSDADNTYQGDVYTNAAGTFSHAGTFGSSLDFKDAAAGDIDGDGDIDFVISYQNGSYLRKLVNNGSGMFTGSDLTASLSTAVTDVLLFDVDQDGDLDIIAGGNAHNAAVYLNNAAGVFTAASSTLRAFTAMAAGDFDSDGDIDLVLTETTSNTLSIYKNSGTGAFISLSTAGYTVGHVGTHASVGDIDGDGDLDLVVSTDGGINSPFLNNGAGTFSLGTNFTDAGTPIYDTGLADIDNDGDIDAISPGSGGADDSWLNNASAIFSLNGSSGETNYANSMAIADIDDDGDLDYTVANANGATGVANRFYVSNQAATLANTAPSAPSTVSVTGALVSPSPKNGGTFEDDTNIGTTLWTNVSNAQLSDDSYVQPGSMTLGQTTHYLKVTNFRLSIPSSATITGIKVDVERASISPCIFYDNAVRIVKGGTIQSTDRSNVTAWPASDAYISYGGASDLWGATFTPSDISSSDFGFAISGQCTGAPFGGGRIDHIRVTVYYDMRDIRLSWGSGSDTETSTRLLQYQLKLGTGSSANNYVSGVTTSPNWVNRMMPNGQSRTQLVKNLPCRTGLTYYWSVSAVDTGFKKTASAEQTFTIDSSCAFSTSGGGSSGGSTGGSTGGGISAKFFDRSGGAAPAADLQGASAPANAIITVTVFNDFNADGIKNGKDDFRFTGLPVTASGRTVDDVLVKKTLLIPASGLVRFGLPASDKRGYWIIADTGSVVLRGYESTNRSASGGYVVKYGGKASVGFGFRRIGLLRYQPCLSVGTFSVGEQPGTDAEILLQRLQDSFGKKISKGFDTTQELISRRDFFTLLSLTHCIEQIRDTTILEKKLRDVAKRFSIVFPLIDLPLSLSFKDSLLMYSLLAAGTDVGRNTTIGDAADLVSPITREEALRAIETILNIPERDKKLTGVLPKDLKPTDAFAPNVLILQNLGLLPGSFQPILGRSQGLNKQEAALLLARAAFRGGKIFLHAETVDTKKLKKAAPVTTPTFLAGIPALKVRACLEKNEDRTENVSFTDILPGDTLYPDLRDILSYGTKNTAKLTLWLFPVTHRPTEFGIIRGQTEADLTEPVSLLETVRDLLVLACLPPPTAIDVMSGRDAYNNRQGSAERRVPRDRISGLPRDATFSSRVLYRAQDHQKEFDLSLFRFNPDFLRNEIRSPATGLSVLEASRILASGLLMIQVKSKVMTTQDAENAMEALTAAIRKDLVGKDIDWRNESELRTIPFTRGMLLQYLATIVNNRTSISSVPVVSKIPIGEIWWERIK